jgi:hypothetical protein
MRKLLLIVGLLGLFLTPSMTWGTSIANIYYAQSAAGSGDGSSCANAYAYNDGTNGFSIAGKWGSGSTQIGPGTTAHICGTITGVSMSSTLLTFKGSGTAGSPITLKFETGAGLSAPSCGGVGGGTGCILVSNVTYPRSYITIDGGTPCGWTLATGSEGTCNGTIVNTNSGTGLTAGTSTNGIEMTFCTNCEVKNLGIYNIYVQSGGDTNANPQGENCITFSGTNILIHDNLMHDVGWCLWYSEVNGDDNLQIYNNEIYNTPHPVNFSGGATGTATNAFFYSNHFHDYENWNDGGYHVEGIHTDGTGCVFNGLYFYNNFLGPGTGHNLFANVYFSVNAVGAGNPGMVNNSAVFNNLILMDGTGGEYGIDIGAGNGNVVYNNTIVNTNTSPLGSGGNSGGGLAWTNISQNSGWTFNYKNNAIQGFYMMVQNDVTGHEDTYGATITGDYNAYSQCPGYGSVEGNCLNAFVVGGGSNWANYMANSFGQEQHSKNTGLFSSTYCCTGTLGLNSSLQPLAGSVVIGNGVNLYSVCNGQPNPGLGALCNDIAGNARPVSDPWDMGAYEYGTLPAVTLSGFGGAFGNQRIAVQSATQTVTVTNSGTGSSLTITTAAIGGTNASDFAATADTCTGATVTAGNTCVVTLRITPGGLSARAGTLTFTDNATGSPQVVTLSGTGIVVAAAPGMLALR